MIFERPVAGEMITESDVEQKFLYPLLVGERPLGLAYDSATVHTKANIRRFKIGKGSDEKSYFPDFVIARGGVPLVIAEAKTPGANLKEAYREARLYANEINSQYPSGLQPVFGLIATDGRILCAGTADHAEPRHNIILEDINIYSASYVEFVSEFDVAALGRALAIILPKIRPKRYWKPRKLVGGVSVQREEVGLNSFGATISANFSAIFNPLSLPDRKYIAKNAYISSKRRERYVDPIDRVIRASTPASESRSKTIDDTATPVEIIKTLRSSRPLEHQVLLIVGSAGAGKTTFVDHLEEVALPTDVRARTVWLRIDMNPAPISRTEIYDWLRDEIISNCRASDPTTDYDELEAMKAVHNGEMTKFRKGVGRLYERDKTVYDQKAAEHLQGVLSNKHLVAQNYASYCSTNRAKLLIIVLDNCDKRLRDEQLLMFEAAQWIQREFRGLVVLPLREETYDNHQNEPPLDTALKDLVFRIEPPNFQRILQSRMQLAMVAIRGSQVLRYELPNGMHVDYPASDQGHYLASILRSVFNHDMHVRRLIVGLAGRNMRRAMEIFLDFCTSGHIGEDHILKMVQSKGQYVLPLSLVTTVLLRSNLRFYDSDRAYLKNVYAASELDDRPSFFVRILIMRWLDEHSDTFGPKRLKGYVRVGDMRAELTRFGVEEAVFSRELESLAKGFCVFSEDFRVTELSGDDLVSLAPAGRVHLQICSDVFYLAAIAEDSWFEVEAMARAVADRIKNPMLHNIPRTVLYNAKDVLASMLAIREKEVAAYASVFDDDRFGQLTNLDGASRAVTTYERSLTPGGWASVPDRYKVDACYPGVIVNSKNFGFFVDLEPGITGLLHHSKLGSWTHRRVELKVGMRVQVKLISMEHIDKKISLKLVDILQV